MNFLNQNHLSAENFWSYVFLYEVELNHLACDESYLGWLDSS